MITSVVTGADGFAGSHLVDNLLKNGYHVIAMVRHTPILFLPVGNSNLKVVQADVMDYPAVQKALQHVDQVYHLAAISGIEETRRSPKASWEVNTLGTLNILDACLENRVQRMMYCSTCHVYGEQPYSALPITEETMPRPVDIYSAGKYAGELMCRAAMNMHPELDVVITRGFNHFGPRQRESWLIPKIIMQALRGNTIKLGAGTPTRDFNYVDNIVNGYRLAVEKGKRGEIYQFCSGQERSVEQVVKAVTTALNWTGQVEFSTPRSADMSRSYGSATKAWTDLDWHSDIKFEDGLQRTIDWFKKERDRL